MVRVKCGVTLQHISSCRTSAFTQLLSWKAKLFNAASKSIKKSPSCWGCQPKGDGLHFMLDAIYLI